MRRLVVLMILLPSAVAAAAALGTQFVLRDYSVDVFHLQPRNQLHEHPIGHDWVAATEQEWIVTDVVGAIDGIARLTPDVKVTVHSSALDANGPRRAANTAFDVVADGVSMRVAVVDHIWSPEMYAPLAARLLGASAPPAADGDLDARTALVDRRVETLLDANRRISASLQTNMRSAPAHEAAAVLIGAFALRESANLFTDVRPALSRMTAHLAVARALRGTAPPSRDGLLALAILAEGAGLQRQALEATDRFESGSSSDADHAWSRAMRLRITGDWRMYQPSQLTTLAEQIEYARALREHVDLNAMMAFLDTIRPVDVADWHRFAISSRYAYPNIEGGHRFASGAVPGELSEARRAWNALHDQPIESEDALIAALNDRPGRTPVYRTPEGTRVEVLDWGTWAASSQRHVCSALVLMLMHAHNLRGDDAIDPQWRELDRHFSGLALYPLVGRWALDIHAVVSTPDYQRVMAAARPVAEHAPELLTAAAWNYLLQPPHGTRLADPFPIDRAWFESGSPAGTAFDLDHRALQAGCPWKADLGDVARWAQERPYDDWTQWSSAWLPVTGKPSLTAVRKAMGPLLDYHVGAVTLLYEYMDMSVDDRVELGRKMCELNPDACVRVADLLLLDHRERDAAAAYERWIANARDEVTVSNSVSWLARYYRDVGRTDDARTIATRAGHTGSARGLRTLGEQLEAEGRDAEAEDVYRDIADSYPNVTEPLGTFLLKRALATRDAALQAEAMNLLRSIYPDGLQRPNTYELDAVPRDGAVFGNFGRRPSSVGFRADDIIVRVDGWRVRTAAQVIEAMWLDAGNPVAFTLWRGGKYQEVRLTVPQHYLGVVFRDYVPSARPQ
ncbi:MAG TPA: hypothetical protein VN654_04185 [Vicinamibacterales bacterium]|nr:hypothetical protein [Vicinamibacterales bacterium]